MNRLQRRMARFRKGWSERRGQAATARPPRRDEPGTPADVTDARAKAQRHGKVTADKWNQ